MKKLFRIGDHVRVVANNRNASMFTILIDHSDVTGVYSIPTWKTEIFQIAGPCCRTKIMVSPQIYGAYPLVLDGKFMGYVYNNALEKVK